MPSWKGGTLSIDAGSITDDSISSAARIDADKQQHLYRCTTNFALGITGTPVAREELLYVAEVAGTIRQFAGLAVVDGSSASITLDLKKNGTTCLSSVVTITNATGDGTVVDGTLSVTSVAVGDRLSVALAVSSSTGMQGVTAWFTVEENGAP